MKIGGKERDSHEHDRGSGQLAWMLRTTGTTWVTSPSAENRSTKRLAGAAGRGSRERGMGSSGGKARILAGSGGVQYPGVRARAAFPGALGWDTISAFLSGQRLSSSGPRPGHNRRFRGSPRGAESLVPRKTTHTFMPAASFPLRPDPSREPNRRQCKGGGPQAIRPQHE